jgi:prepilin-type N-terminal cleavage/methylation domain-containing protein
MNKRVISVKKGFTIIELIIVLAIMGLLTRIVLSSLSKSRENVYNTKISANAVKVRDAIIAKFADTGETFSESGCLESVCPEDNYFGTSIEGRESFVSKYLSGKDFSEVTGATQPVTLVLLNGMEFTLSGVKVHGINFLRKGDATPGPLQTTFNFDAIFYPQIGESCGIGTFYNTGDDIVSVIGSGKQGAICYLKVTN